MHSKNVTLNVCLIKVISTIMKTYYLSNTLKAENLEDYKVTLRSAIVVVVVFYPLFLGMEATGNSDSHGKPKLGWEIVAIYFEPVLLTWQPYQVPKSRLTTSWVSNFTLVAR